ncbi:GLPGLI family protein [Pedobacter aquatilis]|uniref:GLPGLI family protein n=1 Tax=Pedobacter aquatilis TaxID=351343 RepID=UPI00292F6A0B|nr:GLPGLI family protein [Pedobacter aquatilis]
MKRTILIFHFALVFATKLYAQKPDKVLARVRYTYTNLLDTLPSGKTRTENMLLFTGKNASLYTSYDKLNYEIASDNSFRASIKNRIGNGRPQAVIIDTKPSEWMTTSSCLYFNKEDKFFTKEVIALQSYVYEEKPPQISWQITKDTLSFSGLSCKKATGKYNGKNWIAWFSTEYPLPYGPWKLIGLPGLIIEAYDEDQLIKFQFAGIENARAGEHERIDDVTKRPNAAPGDFNPIDQLIGRDVGTAYFENTISLPQNAVKTDKKSLDKLKVAFKKDPKGFVKSSISF